jgi:cation transport ATPase
MLGTTVSFITGILSLLTDIRSFAAISAMIMAIHLTGRTIESTAQKREGQLIELTLYEAVIRYSGNGEYS